MKTQACAALVLILSLPAFGQYSDPGYGQETRGGHTAAQGTLKQYRISFSAMPAFFSSGTISDYEPKDTYSEIYPFGFGLNLNFEYNWVPGFSTGTDIAFLYFPDSDDLSYTDTSFSPAFTMTYHFSGMLLLPLHVFFKFRFPFGLPGTTWFSATNPPAITGFSLYVKPSFGLTYLTNKVKLMADGGTYGGIPYPSQEMDYWEAQSLFSYRFSFGFEIASNSRASGFFELFYHGTAAPDVVDDFTDKSSPFGMFGFMGGAIIAF